MQGINLINEGISTRLALYIYRSSVECTTFGNEDFCEKFSLHAIDWSLKPYVDSLPL